MPDAGAGPAAAAVAAGKQVETLELESMPKNGVQIFYLVSEEKLFLPLCFSGVSFAARLK